ncbi:MAG TPA: hypothetical protein VEC01_05115 [Noviherbaspirillum sp.]|uniref:hypothetical protein n=1 Tax=Noviherbaspirillum sp. TaxID=1926288 RepID=UPI002D60F39F|nr:hypothetical protein [Noviherbaspirillum sp.]HYD94685.1 hypothetical protein [Noviherbaspirillum sp.]
MKKIALVTSIALSLATIQGARATEQKNGTTHAKGSAVRENRSGSDIRVVGGGWGNVGLEEIQVLLNAVAAEMLVHFPGHRLDPIVVSSSQYGPVVLYQRGPQNEYQVLLAAKGNQWAEYVYEFAHELFHILAHYEYHAPPRRARHQWFEEMLCETVSLYMLKRFSLTWEQSPPRSEWKDYAPNLNRFTRRALEQPHRKLPKNISFQKWFQENGPVLATKPYLREKNELVAMFFLPLLEQNPDWRAVTYLNLNAAQGDSSFYDHLAHWHRMTPTPHKQFVTQAMRLFHFTEPAEGDRLLTLEQPTVRPDSEAELRVGPAGPAGQ